MLHTTKCSLQYIPQMSSLHRKCILQYTPHSCHIHDTRVIYTIHLLYKTHTCHKHHTPAIYIHTSHKCQIHPTQVPNTPHTNHIHHTCVYSKSLDTCSITRPPRVHILKELSLKEQLTMLFPPSHLLMLHTHVLNTRQYTVHIILWPKFVTEYLESPGSQGPPHMLPQSL